MATSLSEKDRQKRLVFLVDDHPLVREWLTNLINQQADLVVCGEAETRPQAIERIAVLKPDIAIVDISLKGSSGLELIKDITAICPSVVVLVLSMHDESHYAERALRAGARGYIMKRENTRNVIVAIRRVLSGQPYLSNAIATLIATRLAGAQPASGSTPMEQLSDRELEVFQMLGQGRGTRQIAEDLGISLKTVQAYCARIKEKLNLQSASELLREALRWSEQLRQA
ncbi:MAG TPA: response regulator transcription factor [Candidatus Eisenbacteria bacterium]|jgi:DNA-binding NarL/FixJ family response regulator|nr:response regulator transcription factor [Candidatus Eisenbacteria bacterium]